jgi:uncharacterized protein YkwD
MRLPLARRCLGFCTTATIAAVGASPFLGVPPATAMTAEANTFLVATNAVRTFFQENRLAENSTLDAKAQFWANAMAVTHTLVHSNLAAGLQSLPWTMLGENVGDIGPCANPDQAIANAFVSSWPHFLNLVNPGWTSMGVGVARAADGTVWVAEEFARLG